MGSRCCLKKPIREFNEVHLMKYFILFMCCIFSCSPVSMRDKAFQYYFSNDLHRSQKCFYSYLESQKDDIAAKLYLAENERRLENVDESIRISREVLATDSCNDVALGIIGNSLNPQYGNKAGSYDSSWKYLTKSIKCNSGNGDSWLSIWILSFYFNKSDTAYSALKNLSDSRFFTPKVMAFNRWLLDFLPDSAILLVNGDMDTYPASILQSMENIRKDVAIVNASLLNLKFYFKYVTGYYNIPLLFNEKEIERLDYRDKTRSNVETISDQIIQKWVFGFNDKKIKRPVCFSSTLSNQYLEPYKSNLFYKGPFFQYSNQIETLTFDTTAVERSLQNINYKDFSGPDISESDISPVRRNGARKFGQEYNLLETGIWLASVYAQSGKKQKALAMTRWLAEFQDFTRHYKDIEEGIKRIADVCKKKSAFNRNLEE
jgi:hypothetical protein